MSETPKPLPTGELRKLLAEYHANPQCRCPGWGDHPGHTKKAIEIQPQHLEALLDAVEERDRLRRDIHNMIAGGNGICPCGCLDRKALTPQPSPKEE